MKLSHDSSFLSSLIFLLLFGVPSGVMGQNQSFYIGDDGSEAVYDVVQLSDGTFLLAGVADNLDWIPDVVNRVEISPTGIANDEGTNRISFLLHTDDTLGSLLNVIYLPAGGAEDFRFIKSTNLPRMATGDLYLSGNTEDDEDGGYFIGQLNDNFVNGIPTAFEWTYNVKCKTGDYPKLYHPWDVDAQGRVYFVGGDSHDWDWSAMYRLNAQGELDVVEHWRTHWKTAGGEFRGTPASSVEGGIEALDFSAIVFKRDSRCNLRSWSQEDYEQISTDGNGGTKQGKWPLDVLFAAPCDPSGDTPTNGPGYTGYSPGSGFTFGPSSVCIDRRNNDLYLGLNVKSSLPGGNPDFEPAVIKMDSEGGLLWWSRLYHERRADGSLHNSSPDQYVDGLAIDYSVNGLNGKLVVNARCHGNNVENLWEGNSIEANLTASSYQNQFTGSTGNIHISWLGKLSITDGSLQYSTYVAEMGQNTNGLGSEHPDPLLAGWPDPNSGWIELNTTKLVHNSLKTTADGSVIILGVARRPMTTRNAYLKMPNPYYAGYSAWSAFVRQYNDDFSLPQYSSIVRGQWDTLTAQPPLNLRLYNAFKATEGIVVVGQHLGIEGEVPVANVPSWAEANYAGESGFVAFLQAEELYNEADSPVVTPVSVTDELESAIVPRLYPNPTGSLLHIATDRPFQRIEIYDLYGRKMLESTTAVIDMSILPASLYSVKIIFGSGHSYVEQVYKS